MLENVIHRLLQRRVMKPVVPGLVLFLLLGLAARSGGVVVERVEVPLPGLPAELDGLTIVHISVNTPSACARCREAKLWSIPIAGWALLYCRCASSARRR